MTNLWGLWEAAEREGAAPALGGADAASRAELGARIRAAAAALAQHAAPAPGRPLAILAPNGAAFVTAYFAAQHRGAVALPLDDRLGTAALVAMVAHAEAAALLADSSLAELAAEVGSAAGGVPVHTVDDLVATGRTLDVPQPLRPPSEAPAELLYTSGTTGQPKGVVRSHGAVLAAVANARAAFGYRAGDVIAIVMPLSHSSALTSQLLPVLQAGGTAVLLPRFDPATLVEAIAAEGVTCVRLVPAMIRLLLARDDFRAEALPTLRLVLNSSAPVDPEVYRELKRRFAAVEVLNSYGLTEASTCTVLPDRLALTHPESVGFPLPGVRFRIRGEAGLDAAPGEEGEIWIAGAHVFSGYHRDSAATAAARADEWFRTGDVGRRDADGLLYLVGRSDHLINCGGHKVAPEAVERWVATAPGVRDAACGPMPHRVLGQVVRAYVVPEDPARFDSRAVVRWCRAHLPSYAVPFDVAAVTELPRNATGKVVRARLFAPSDPV